MRTDEETVGMQFESIYNRERNAAYFIEKRLEWGVNFRSSLCCLTAPRHSLFNLRRCRGLEYILGEKFNVGLATGFDWVRLVPWLVRLGSGTTSQAELCLNGIGGLAKVFKKQKTGVVKSSWLRDRLTVSLFTCTHKGSPLPATWQRSAPRLQSWPSVSFWIAYCECVAAYEPPSFPMSKGSV